MCCVVRAVAMEQWWNDQQRKPKKVEKKNLRGEVVSHSENSGLKGENVTGRGGP
jgi:hypothetical protein